MFPSGPVGYVGARPCGRPLAQARVQRVNTFQDSAVRQYTTMPLLIINKLRQEKRENTTMKTRTIPFVVSHLRNTSLSFGEGWGEANNSTTIYDNAITDYQ